MLSKSSSFAQGVPEVSCPAIFELPLGWEWRALGEVATFINGDRSANYPKKSDFVPNGVAFVNTGHIEPNGELSQVALDYISRECFDRLRSGRLVKGDIVYCLRGSTIGKTARVDLSEGSVASSLVIIRAKPVILQDYLYYFLVSPLGQSLVRQYENGSAQPNLSVSAISQYPIPIPPIGEQEAIAAALGALDEKIKLNRRMNSTLEAIARLLFQSWFVDFDPVRAKLDGREPIGIEPAAAALFPDGFQESPLGHIPKGWGIGSILRQAELMSGGTPKTDVPHYWNGDVPWASAKDVSQCGEAFLVTTERTITERGLRESSAKIIPANATVIVARGATTGRLTMFGHAMAMNQTCYALRSRAGADFALYCNARHFIDRLVQGGHGSIFDTITTSTFEATNVLLAPEEVLLAFDQRVIPLFQKVHANLLQSRALATLRDTLLPKLLSGELGVSTAAEQIEAQA